MDIIASLAPAVSPDNAGMTSPASTASESSFSSVLSQVSEPPASTPGTGAAPSTPAPAAAPGVASAATAAPDAEAQVAAPAEPTPALPAQVPTQAVVAQAEPSSPLPAPVQPAPLPVQDTELTVIDPTLADAPEVQVANGDSEGADDTPEVDSLDDIRRRMALIESAGQLDPTSMLAAPAIPLSAPVMVMSSAAQTTTVEAPDTDTELRRPSLALAGASLEADTDADVAEPPALPDGLPTPLANGLDTARDAAGQASSRSLDSQPDASASADVQGAFSPLAPASTPALASGTDKVASNGLVLAAAVGTAQWQSGLGQQMIDMVTRGEQQVDLRLHPAELGPLSISLNLNDGTTQAQFQAAHASVRAAVEQALPQLREALAAQGIALGQATVSDQSSRQAAGDQAQRDPQGSHPGAANGSERVAPEAVLPEAVAQQVVLRSSGVDLYV